MKTIGILGGMAWESSAVYYRLLNQKINEKLGGFASCRCIMNSVEFSEIESLVRSDDWTSIDAILSKAAADTENAGADFLLVASNTAHLCYEAIVKNITIPFLHIAEATGNAIASRNLNKVALLGTKYTMEKDFYRSYIRGNYGIEVITPPSDQRLIINDIIFKELIQGEINNTSREIIISIINELQSQGAEGVILGCTEIPLLISQTDVSIPVFDTTLLHVEMAVELALK